ncbi:MAG: glutathione synthase [Cyanobacteria bacterium J06648_11]
MRVAFVIDPLATLQAHHDTSVMLMEALQQRGHEVYAFEMHEMWVVQGQTWAHLSRLQVDVEKTPWFAIAERIDVPLSELDAVWMRKDPPVDAAYIRATQLLDLASTLVLNHPAALRSANEKLFALQFPQWTPETLVTQDAKAIAEFVKSRGRAVLKPLDGKGGEGIFFLEKGDRNLNSLIEVSTQFGRIPVMVQEYLPAAAAGDKRILLLDGKPLGAINRLPGSGDFRGNIAAGGSVAKTDITPKEFEICADVAPVLQQNQLYFVGLDVIGERLTEINVTSPTMLREMSQQNDAPLGAEVVAWLEGCIQT